LKTYLRAYAGLISDELEREKQCALEEGGRALLMFELKP